MNKKEIHFQACSSEETIVIEKLDQFFFKPPGDALEYNSLFCLIPFYKAHIKTHHELKILILPIHGYQPDSKQYIFQRALCTIQ